jgi:hypothetical protein
VTKFITFVVCGLALAACKPKDAGLPPLPSYASAQQAAWQHAPADTELGVVVADPSHVLERLRALRAVLVTGKVTKTYLDKLAPTIKETFGFDPLDEAAWVNAGFDPKSPIAFFGGKNNVVQAAFRVNDAKKVQAWLSQHNLQLGEGNDCGAEGELFRCGSTTWKLAPDAAHSLWPHIGKNVAPAQSGMEIFAYAPLDQGEAKDAIGSDQKMPFHNLTAGYGGITIARERVVFDGAVVGSELTTWLAPFLRPRPGESLIGLLAGATSAGRFTFSPDAIWASVKKNLGNELGQATGYVQAATGFDVEKDLMGNLTGEVVWGGYVGPKSGSDGKPRSYAERVGYAMVIGTRDDATTRRVADRLGEVGGGAIGSFGAGAEALGFKVSYRVETAERKVHWVSVLLGEEQAKAAGLSHFDIGLTSVPGGLAIVFGPGLEELRRRAGTKPQAMLDRLPHADARAAFSTMPLAMWSLLGEEFVSRHATVKDEELTEVIRELTEVAQLLYDGLMYVDLSSDRARLFYQVTLL